MTLLKLSKGVKEMKTQLNQTLEKMVDAIAFYHDTGKHKQVNFRYDPLVRTTFDF